MLFALVAFFAVFGFGLGSRLRLFTVAPTDARFLIYLNAAIHFVFMADVYKDFGLDSDGAYFAIAVMCMSGLLIGFAIERRMPRANLNTRLPQLDSERNDWLAMVALVIVLVVSLANFASYVQVSGSINPVAGMIRYFTSGNLAAEMWDTTGAQMYGAERGAASAGDLSGGGPIETVLFYLTVRLQPAIYLAIGLVRKRWRFGTLCLYVASSIVQISAGYFARTSILLTLGLVALYFHQNIRRFRRSESIVMLGGSLLLFLILHLGRVGQVDSVEALIGDQAVEGYRSAASATFEPIAFAMLYHDTVGVNSFEDNLEHFAAYLGIFVPRVFWSNKPYYALEPDMTMALTGRDINASNVVRTFTVAGEGLMVGGPIGVLVISIAFGFVASIVFSYLCQRRELEIFQFYFTLLSAYAFRLSLFTFFVGNVVLTLVPVAIVYAALLIGFGSRARVGRNVVGGRATIGGGIRG